MIIGFGGGGGGVTLVSIAITPGSPSPSLGHPVQLTAMGTYSDSSQRNITSAVTWASSNQAAATVTSGTTGGLLSAVATGTSNITATLDGVTGSTTCTVTSVMFRSSMAGICNGSGSSGSNAVYVRKMFVTDNVTHLRMANRFFLTSGAATVPITTDVAIGTSNGGTDTNLGFSGAPIVLSNQVIPGDGTVWDSGSLNGGLGVAPGVDGCIVISYSVPAGRLAAFEALTCHGYYTLNTLQVNPLPAATALNPSPAFQVHVEYQTGRRRVIGITDSIGVGTTSNNPPSVGFERAALYLLGIQKNWAVDIEGLPGGTTTEFANFGTYTNLWDEAQYLGADIVIETGVNQLSGGAVAMQTDLTNLVTHLRSLGVGKIYVCTIAPQASYPNTETTRTTYNSFCRANSLGLDGVIDLAAKKSLGGLASDTDLTVLDAGFSSDGTHLSASGQVQSRDAMGAVM